MYNYELQSNYTHMEISSYTVVSPKLLRFGNTCSYKQDLTATVNENKLEVDTIFENFIHSIHKTPLASFSMEPNYVK